MRLFFHNFTYTWFMQGDKRVDILNNPVIGDLQVGSKYPDVRIPLDKERKEYPKALIVQVGDGWIDIK